MDTWAPLFSRIVDSSIWQEDDYVIKVFLTMLAKKDKDHIVRGNAYMIAAWAKKDEATVLKALKVLMSPDTRRIEKQPFDGRRIEKVEDGYLVLNGDKYRKMLSESVKRQRKRAWANDKRASKGPASKREAEYIARQNEHGLEPMEAGAKWVD